MVMSSKICETGIGMALVRLAEEMSARRDFLGCISDDSFWEVGSDMEVLDVKGRENLGIC